MGPEQPFPLLFEAFPSGDGLIQLLLHRPCFLAGFSGDPDLVPKSPLLTPYFPERSQVIQRILLSWEDFPSDRGRGGRSTGIRSSEPPGDGKGRGKPGEGCLQDRIGGACLEKTCVAKIKADQERERRAEDHSSRKQLEQVLRPGGSPDPPLGPEGLYQKKAGNKEEEQEGPHFEER